MVVVGASDRAGSVGATVWRNLRSGGFAGPVLAVNSRPVQLDGGTAFARLADLPQVPELAVVCTPPATVAGLIDELGRLGTHAAIVVSAGQESSRPPSVRLDSRGRGRTASWNGASLVQGRTDAAAVRLRCRSLSLSTRGRGAGAALACRCMIHWW